MLLVVFALIAFCVQSQESICDKYSQALKVSNLGLVTTVVNSVVGLVVATNAPTKKYFDGTKPEGSLDFTNPKNAPALTALVNSLISFFGAALDCSDGTIPPYTGAKMGPVHQPMGISSFEFNFFNDAVVTVLKNAGVDELDYIAVKIKLIELKSEVVVQNSICDRYSAALKVNNNDLVSLVVVTTIKRITLADTPIVQYFNGVKPPGSMNFLNPKNKLALDGLIVGLTSFFGAALGCSDDTVPVYGGPPLKFVHRLMKINEAEFDFFNQAVVGTMRSAGVTAGDLRTVLGLLNSTKSDIVGA